MPVRRRSLIVILALTTLAAGFAAALDSGPLPQPAADELWWYITQEDPYTDWQPFPVNPELGEPPWQMTEKPHGDWVHIYVNEPAYQSLHDPLKPFSMRYGSILVKENYPASATAPARDTILSLTVMYKVRGYRTLPDEDEWFWVMYSPTGRVVQLADQPFLQNPDFGDFKGEVQAGKPWFCVSCHRAAQTTSTSAVGDYVWKLKPFRGTQQED